jgi:hypothetical protein
VKTAVFFFCKRFQNTKSNPKFDHRGVVLVIPMPGKKVLEHRSGCILLRKNFWNGVLAHSVEKCP